MSSKPRIPKAQNKKSSSRPCKQWTNSAPYKDGYTPHYSDPSIGIKTKIVNTTDDGKTILTPEWYHYDI